MDPNVTWREALTAIAEDRFDEASELLENLQAWLERGGFFPTVSGTREDEREVVDKLLAMARRRLQEPPS